MIMVYTLVVVACVFSGVAMLAALHTLVSFNRIDSSFKEWSQSLSDDCNRALDVRYGVLVDAMKKDVKAAFDAQFGSYEDLSDGQISDLSDGQISDLSDGQISDLSDGQIFDLSDVEQYVDENTIKINV